MYPSNFENSSDNGMLNEPEENINKTENNLNNEFIIIRIRTGEICDAIEKCYFIKIRITCSCI